MKNLSRAAVAAVAVVGLSAFAAPAAFANDTTAGAHHGGGHTFVFGDVHYSTESGPGDHSSSSLDGSHFAKIPAHNEATKTGHIAPWVHGKGHTVPIELEGSEQDQGEQG